MKLMTTTALALAAVAFAGPAAAQGYGAAAPPQPSAVVPPASSAPATAAPATSQIKLSKKASKAIVALQTAVKANDVATIPTKLAEAQAVAETAEDRYAIGQLQLTAALAAKNNEAAILAVDYIATANYLPKPTVAGLYNQLGVEFFNAKNKPRAQQLFQKALTVDPANSEAQRLLAETQMSTDPAQAAATMKKAMLDAVASGKKLPEDSYKRAVKAAYDSKSPDAVEIGRYWVAAYPNAESWRNSIAIYRNMMRPNVQGSLDLLRLMRAAGAMSTSGDYTLYATAAADQGNFNEAQSVIDEGTANQRLKTSDPVARDTINGLKSKPKASPAELEASVKSAASGSSLVKIGDRFYGLGNYARAAELYRQALTKGADASLANLHLGMALARTGDNAGAKAALSAVSGPNAEIAKYWLIYVNRAG